MHRQILENVPLDSATQNSTLKTHNCHRLYSDGFGIDHINANLRLATVAQNAWNSRKRKSRSIFKGVCFIRDKQKFRACIWANRKRHHLGYFDNEIDAAKAYDQAAKKLHKDFAVLNFPR
jgi:hypothetical protein